MASRKKQLEFFGKEFRKPSGEFGGSLLTSNPKYKRPLDSKFPILLTMRAEKSILRLPKAFAIVKQCIETTANKYGVRVYKEANVGNHLHLVIKLTRTSLWSPFIRELSGRIAQKLCEEFNLNFESGFWKFRPHTRIVRGWKRAFRIALDYVYLNQLEGEGKIDRKDIKTLAEYRARFGNSC